MKICTACKLEKASTLECFGPDKRRPCGLQSQCRQCMRKGRNLSNQKYREKVNENASTYRLANRKKYRQYFAEYNQTSERRNYLKDHFEKNKDRYHAKYNTWRLANKIKRNASSRITNATRRYRIPGWLTKNNKIEMEWAKKIARERSKETGIRHHADHIIPFHGKIISGLHVPWNVQIITEKENMLKQNSFDGTYDNKGWSNG